MKNEDVKIGMKVVPFQKTAGLERFNFVWNRVKAQNQLFLYVVKKHNTSWILNCSKNDKTGDYYNACDFEPYIEKKSITKNIKHIITGNKTIVVIQNEDGTYLKGESKCNPQDKFDEQEGFRVAYSRAIGKEPFEKSVMVQDNEQSNITTNKLQVNKKLWHDFLHYKIAIYCPTKQEANVFLQYLNNISFCWKKQGDLLTENNWNHFKENTYYSYHFAFPKKIQYGTVEDKFLLNAKLIKIKDLFMNYSPNKLSYCTNNKL